MRVLLDVDGVLADFVGGWLEAAFEVTGIRYRREDIKEHLIEKALGIDAATGAEIRRRLCREDFCTGLMVCDGALEGVARLREQASVVAVTAPLTGSKYWMGEREAWLMNLFGFKAHDIVFCSQKHLIFGEVLIDDRVANLRDWIGQWGFRLGRNYAIAWNTPHNQNDEWPLRVSTWPELQEMLFGGST